MSEHHQITRGENVRNEILRLLQSKKFYFQHFIHVETAAQDVAKEIGVTIQEGIKCLVMRGKKSCKNYLICVRGHQKVDMRAVSALIDENCEFEKIETIKERFGLDVGGTPPFGALLNLDVYFDRSIQSCKEVIFSCGLRNESVRMKLEDLIPLINPKFAVIAKE